MENLNNSQSEQAPPAQPNHQVRSRQIITSFEARVAGRKTTAEKMADYSTTAFGSPKFLTLNLIFFLAWIFLNLGIISGLPILDPFPFNLLTMVVSLEAIFLSVLVLMAQNREAMIDKLRSEVDLQINVIAEQEITKIISLLSVLLEKHGVDVTSDPEVQKMLKRVDPWHIEKKIEEQLKQSIKRSAGN